MYCQYDALCIASMMCCVLPEHDVLCIASMIYCVLPVHVVYCQYDILCIVSLCDVMCHVLWLSNVICSAIFSVMSFTVV